jgi:Chaperone of endosialidase
VLGTSADTNVMRIGKTTQKKVFVGGIRGIKTAKSDAIPVVINSAGQLGTISSSERFKKDIEPMEKSSEAIFGLKPVTFHYKEDSTATPQFGLIAEQVAKVDPDLVVRDENGMIYTVRYDAVNAMLFNEFLKGHPKVQELQKQVAILTTTVEKVNSGPAKPRHKDSKRFGSVSPRIKDH